MGIEPGADRGAADRQFAQAGQGLRNRAFGKFKLRHIAGKLLPQRQRRGVLQMGAPDLDDIAESLRFCGECFSQCAQRRLQRSDDLSNRRDMHRRRKYIVRRLPAVDLIVGVHQALHAALATQQFRGAIGQHLVDVHIGLRARPGLPHAEGKFGRMFAGKNFIGRFDNGAGDRAVNRAQVTIDHGGGTFHQGQCVDQRRRHLLAGNMEMMQRALRLSAP